MAASCLREAIEYLHVWQHDNSNNPSFSSMLYTMFGKADMSNRSRLDKAFPLEAEAYRLWHLSEEGGDALFKQYGLMPNGGEAHAEPSV